MTRRRVGPEGARSLAGSGSLDEALATLARSPYGDAIHPGQTLEEAQRGAVATAVWNTRVLAGWLPRDGAAMLRVLLGAIELANITDHVRHLLGFTAPPPYRLGRLGTAWPRIARTTQLDEVRTVLATSTWGDPGGTSERDIALALRTAWADRVIGGVPQAAEWARGWAALLVAREVLLGGRELPTVAHENAARVLGQDAITARSLPDFVAALPVAARRPFMALTSIDDLWRAEVGWRATVEADAVSLVRRARAGPHVVLGAVALLALDAWRVRAALELVAHGGVPLEAFDAVA